MFRDSDKNNINLQNLLKLKETEQLLDAKIISPEHLNERLRWYSGDFEKAKRDIESLYKLFRLEGTKDLLDAKIISPEHLNERLRWYSGDFEKAKRDIESLYKLFRLEGTKDLLDAKIISPEHLNEKLHWYSGDFEKAKQDIVAKLNNPTNKEKIIKNKAYTEGAAAGALSQGAKSKIIPDELSRYAGTFLGRKDGGSTARTSKAAAKTASEYQREAEEKIKSQKKI